MRRMKPSLYFLARCMWVCKRQRISKIHYIYGTSSINGFKVACFMRKSALSKEIFGRFLKSILSNQVSTSSL